jgi:hypothetical protein
MLLYGRVVIISRLQMSVGNRHRWENTDEALGAGSGRGVRGKGQQATSRKPLPSSHGVWKALLTLGLRTSRKRILVIWILSV